MEFKASKRNLRKNNEIDNINIFEVIEIENTVLNVMAIKYVNKIEKIRNKIKDLKETSGEKHMRVTAYD